MRGRSEEEALQCSRPRHVAQAGEGLLLDLADPLARDAELGADLLEGLGVARARATDRLRDRSEDQQYAPNLAREVLNRGRSINVFMRSNRLGGRAESDWARVRSDLNRLSNAYYINWRW